MKKLLNLPVILGGLLVGLIIAIWITAPQHGDPARLDGLTGDPKHGALVFAATGCGSCHMAPDATGEAQLILSGGQAFASPFGTFYAPNISPDDAQGLGGWTPLEFADALQFGVLPDGRHMFPAMPFSAYQHLSAQEIVDLKSYMDDLAKTSAPNIDHDVPFPFNIRRAIGGWKFLFLNEDFVLPNPASPKIERGQHLVEAMAHCGECHSPRNALGAIKRHLWLAGAPTPDGKSFVPNITPGALTWTEEEIVTYLTDGNTPDFDFVGGHMAHVVENMGKLPVSDVQAIAAYLKSVPPIKNQGQP